MHQGNGGIAKTLDRLDAVGRLRVWIAAQNLRQWEFAARVGVHDSLLSMILKGRRPASPEIARKIEAVTGGYVKLRQDVVEHIPEQAQAANASRRRKARAA